MTACPTPGCPYTTRDECAMAGCPQRNTRRGGNDRAPHQSNRKEMPSDLSKHSCEGLPAPTPTACAPAWAGFSGELVIARAERLCLSYAAHKATKRHQRASHIYAALKRVTARVMMLEAAHG